MSRWFRHYAGMMRDDKLVRVAIRSGQTIERVVWVYAAILESAAEIDDGGRYDFDTAEAAYFLRASPEDVGSILDSLLNVGRLSEDHVVKWSDRQFKSDRSAERQAKYRERQRASDAGGETKQTPSERNSNGRVTSLSRHRDAPETELETETEEVKTEAKASSKSLIKRDKLAAIGSCLATAFVLPDDIPADAWAGWEEMRRRLRKSPTDHARTLAITELRRLRDEEGWPPGVVLNHCTMNSYQGIYPPKVQNNGPASKIGSLRGSRPDPALDLLRAARAAEDREDSRRAGPSLPAIGSG